jgi:hypothetical protein
VQFKKHNYIPLDAKTVQKIKKKHRCWTRYRETGDKQKYQEYAKTRNQVKSAIRKAKANMEKEIAPNAKSNPKIFWKYANSKRKTNIGISELKFKSEEGEERKTTTDKEKAEVLASFFSSVFTIEAEGDLPLMHPIEVKQECIEKTFKESEILKLLQNLDVNKSCGPVVVFLSSPSSDLNFSSDIPVLVFLLELAYFQKILGLLLVFCPISFSIIAFAFLIAFLT